MAKKAPAAQAAPKPPAKSASQVAGEDVGVRIRPKGIATYVAGVSGSGKKTKNNGDVVAQALDGLTLEAVTEIAEALIPEATDLGTKYKHLNVGQQRMNLGNRIRGAVQKMERTAEGTGEAALMKAVKPFAKQRATAPVAKDKAA